MKYYQAIRISKNGIPTYGDKYARIASDKELNYNDIIAGADGGRYLILFEEQEATA